MTDAPGPKLWVTRMTIDDAEHISPERRAEIIASYPPHEAEARTKGIPALGSGRVFPVTEESITVTPSADLLAHLKENAAYLGGLDFGWDHPFAAVELQHDRDNDIVYVTRALRMREETPIVHVASIKNWMPHMLWAWPHDGLNTEKSSGETLADQYRKQGLKMCSEKASFTDGGRSVEAGLMEMLDRMRTGRFKVFAQLEEWLREFRLYHRENGVIAKEMDDLMDATRYAVMMLRFAQPKPRPRRPRKKQSAWAA